MAQMTIESATFENMKKFLDMMKAPYIDTSIQFHINLERKIGYKELIYVDDRFETEFGIITYDKQPSLREIITNTHTITKIRTPTVDAIKILLSQASNETMIANQMMYWIAFYCNNIYIHQRSFNYNNVDQDYWILKNILYPLIHSIDTTSATTANQSMSKSAQFLLAKSIPTQQDLYLQNLKARTYYYIADNDY